MTEREYRSAPGISRSQLWRLHDSSPEKFKYWLDHPEEPTPALIFGQAVHKMLLEPEGFGDCFVVAPDGLKRTAKKGWAEFCKDYPGRTAIERDEFDTIVQMVDKFQTAPLVSWLLCGERERPFFWTDEYTGEKCKCRCDILLYEEGESVPTIVDYKTSKNANQDIFNNEIYKYGYHVQAAMYAAGVKAALNLSETPNFKFAVQEKKPPYALNLINIPPEVMLHGQDVFRELLGQYHECNETGYWYGFCGPFDVPNEAYLPGWLQIGTDENEE